MLFIPFLYLCLSRLTGLVYCFDNHSNKGFKTLTKKNLDNPFQKMIVVFFVEYFLVLRLIENIGSVFDKE
jgi:hypothetical protein